MAKATTKTKIVQDKDKPVPVEVLADSVVQISRGITKLLDGPLKEDALIHLIQFSTGTAISKQTIKAVLVGIRDLEKATIKPNHR